MVKGMVERAYITGFLGIASLIGGTAPSFLHVWTPRLQFVALVLGVLIAITTLAINLKRLFKD